MMCLDASLGRRTGDCDGGVSVAPARLRRRGGSSSGRSSFERRGNAADAMAAHMGAAMASLTHFFTNEVLAAP
ncbi:hypothetical protein DFR50_13128 [Roseiarcus fermentans]|uniref:Uncharacterized protein n=1 Tax=Roseiarcus fermentans TaxID=1473586 RepID=A0A366EVK2_9HYPH|nr:hypothetical protein DFR50_13128 [Roseiarcus fermentans]